MDLSPPRGTEDLLPPHSEGLRAAAAAAAREATLHGYRYVETPAFEATELFARTSGESSDVVHKEMYTFEDKGGRSLTLRPEGTAPVVRAFLANAHDLPLPFKAYYLEPMWRYGRPQSGRLREFRQFGIEVIGAADPDADIEVIEVGERFLRACGVPGLRLELNSIGDGECRPAYRDELIAYLAANAERFTDEHRDRFRVNPMRVLDCKDAACRAIAADAPMIVDHLCAACAKHFEAVRAGLERRGIGHVGAPTLVRGLDYYTRTTFEWVSDALPEGQATVGGGGRYDGLAEVLGGPATPGVGFAIGLERVLLAGGSAEDGAGRSVFVVAVGEEALARVPDVAASLREAGISTATAFGPRPLKAQLRMADRAGATFAVIVGEREAAAGTMTIRRLADGDQRELSLAEGVAWIAGEATPS